MTIKYEYICNECQHNYIEQRTAEEAMFFSTCVSCNTGAYEEVSRTVLSLEVERQSAPTVEPSAEEPASGE